MCEPLWASRTTLVLRVDEARLRKTLGTVAARGGRRPRDPRLVIRDDDTVVAGPARGWRSVDRRGLRRALVSAVQDGTFRARAETRELPPVPQAAVRNVVTEADRMLDKDFELRLGGDSGAGLRVDLRGLLRLRAVGRTGARLGVHRKRAERRVRSFASRFTRPARPPRFGLSGSGTTFEAKSSTRWSLRIAAFQAHTLFIDRYPPGRESTLNFPGIDLRWTIDTSAPVVVRTSSTPTAVTVRLLGDNGGRRVRADDGPRRPAPGGDFAITVTRVVRYADGRTRRQPVTIRYELPVG